MSTAMPHDKSLDTDFMFTKLMVDDLEKVGAFYATVFGLVELHRLDAKIVERPIKEIVYKSTYAGGPMFVLVKFLDAPKPGNDQLALGFSTKDLDAFMVRLEKAGGRVLEQTQDDHFRHAFAEDIEGNQLQVTQMIG